MIDLLNAPGIVRFRRKFKLDDSRTVVLFFVCALIIIYLDYALIINPQLGYLRTNLGPKLEKLRTDLQAFDKDSARMREMKDKLSVQGQNEFLTAKRIPSEQDLASILQVVYDLANNNQVKVAGIKPVKEEPKKQSKKSAASQVEDVLPLKLKLELSCDYHHLGRFLNDLDNAQIFFSTQEMRISTRDEDYLNQTVFMTLKTYVRK
jgi:Tfp pilus assembly protein PilO